MTRESEIRFESLKYSEATDLKLAPINLAEEGFIAGAEWADRTMIENACEWLTRELCYTARGNNFFNNKTATDDFVESFKKAMKGD